MRRTFSLTTLEFRRGEGYEPVRELAGLLTQQVVRQSRALPPFWRQQFSMGLELVQGDSSGGHFTRAATTVVLGPSQPFLTHQAAASSQQHGLNASEYQKYDGRQSTVAERN